MEITQRDHSSVSHTSEENAVEHCTRHRYSSVRESVFRPKVPLMHKVILRRYYLLTCVAFLTLGTFGDDKVSTRPCFDSPAPRRQIFALMHRIISIIKWYAKDQTMSNIKIAW